MCVSPALVSVRMSVLTCVCAWRPPEASSPPACVSPAFVLAMMSVLALRLCVPFVCLLPSSMCDDDDVNGDVDGDGDGNGAGDGVDCILAVFL